MIRVFNYRSVCVHTMKLHCFETKLPNFKLKTWPKLLLSSLQLAFAHPNSELANIILMLHANT
jgi:hypothetical protein